MPKWIFQKNSTDQKGVCILKIRIQKLEIEKRGFKEKHFIFFFSDPQNFVMQIFAFFFLDFMRISYKCRFYWTHFSTLVFSQRLLLSLKLSLCFRTPYFRNISMLLIKQNFESTGHFCFTQTPDQTNNIYKQTYLQSDVIL